jgi:hypothetical protein
MPATRNLYLDISLMATTYEPDEPGMTYKLSMGHFPLTITNMATVRKFEVMSDTVNIVGTVSTSENYAQKWFTNVYNY